MGPDNGGRKLHRNVSNYLPIDSPFRSSLNLHVLNAFNVAHGIFPESGRYSVFWDMMPCSVVKIYEHFGQMFYLNL